MEEQQVVTEEDHQQSVGSDERSEKTVKSLRAKGWKVQIFHERKIVPGKTTDLVEVVVGERINWKPNGLKVWQKTKVTEAAVVYHAKFAEVGGRTVVNLLSPDGYESQGVATCFEGGYRNLSGEPDPLHIKEEWVKGDNYCKKVGVKLALGRALDNMDLAKEAAQMEWAEG